MVTGSACDSVGGCVFRYDPMEFCEPQFTCGNGLLLCPQSGILYDRIYCGAGCPAQYVELLKSMMKTGGIMVVPCEEEVGCCLCLLCNCNVC